MLNTFTVEDSQALVSFINKTNTLAQETGSSPTEDFVPPKSLRGYRWPLAYIASDWYLVMENGGCYEQAIGFYTKLYKNSYANVSHSK